MRKLNIILTLIMGTLLFVNANAQYFSSADDPRERMRLGLRAGINFSSLYDTKGDNFTGDSKRGLALGALLSIPIGKFLGFQPEAVYSQKGFEGSGTVLVANYNYSRKLYYLDVPLQLQLKPAPFLTLLAGPQFSFLLHKAYDFNSGSIDVQTQNDIENNNIRKNTLGATVGADIIYSHLILSGRLAWDLQRNNGDGTSTSPRYKLMVAQITAGLIF